MRQIYSDDVDLKGIGETFIDTFEIMIARAQAFKDKHGATSIHDVQYADTLRDPLGVVRGIHDRFGIDWTPEVEAAMTGYLADNPKGKHGRHEYDLAEYGLSKGYVRERFSDYISRYDIPVKD
ncbi:MAG TPA: sulfotransferase [Novosphingobium sp.]|nr:sulfotransferase [Novosphingobium sp.]